MVIQIKELADEECKLKRLNRRIKQNALISKIEVEKYVRANGESIDYHFNVLLPTNLQRLWHWYYPYSVRFWGKLDIKTYVFVIPNVEEHLYDKIYEASKKLFGDIDELTVIIEKDYC